jgi:eukaryotic-like serine/threonine-protein kinase
LAAFRFSRTGRGTPFRAASAAAAYNFLVLQPDTVFNERYRVLEEVGEGGMATVYRALDLRLGRTVALKVLSTQFGRDQPFIQRFQQEAEFAASLGAHPNIVAIYDIGQHEAMHYIVMEFIEGRNLKALIQEQAPFEVPEAFGIGQQVALALDFAHKRGLVHRDVKPQNIMVTPDGIAKVTDFGIARSLSASQLTRTGMVIGTVHYFSPEQASGKPATPAADIYSLGVILYEMLTGHLPFDADSPIGVAMQHVHSDPPSPWDYNPSLPARAVNTVMRALEKDPERRYRDAAEFASALGEQAALHTGATTVFSPVSPLPPEKTQHTAVYETVEPVLPPQPEYVEEVVPRPPIKSERPLPNRWRTAWIAVGAILLALAIGLGSFFAFNAFGGAPKATATPTITPTATPHRKRKQPTATIPAVVAPTSTSPPLPTFTPVPPTATPTPKPAPTKTPLPATPTLPVPTPTGPVG